MFWPASTYFSTGEISGGRAWGEVRALSGNVEVAPAYELTNDVGCSQASVSQHRTWADGAMDEGGSSGDQGGAKANPRTRSPPVPQITRTTVQLSLLITPPSARERDASTLSERLAHLEAALADVRELATTWSAERSEDVGFVDFEAALVERLQTAARGAMELTLALAESRDREERDRRFRLGEVEYRLCRPEPRSMTTWFGTVRYARSYARPLEGGPGWYPLDAALGLLPDRVSPSLLTTAVRLATRLSYAEAREILGWFVPQPPSTEVVQKAVLGLGHHTQAWFTSVPAPADDGEVLVILVDGKCVPTARAGELEKRRGTRADRPKAASPRHRGRDDRKRRGRRPRTKGGEKAKNGKLATMVVMYTLRKEGELLLGPLNRRVYASFGPKRHAFEYAVAEAARRGFAAGTQRTLQLLTDGDPNLHDYVDHYFPLAAFPNRVATVDVIHVLEKLWDAGRARHAEGSDSLRAWVESQEDRLYKDDAEAVVAELRDWLSETPKTGPGNKGRRRRISAAIRYIAKRIDRVRYGAYRQRDLEVGTGQVEGAIKYVIAKRCDHGGMRWIRERAQAVIQLRCIDVNGQWADFVVATLRRLQTQAKEEGARMRLQTKSPAKLPSAKKAA